MTDPKAVSLVCDGVRGIMSQYREAKAFRVSPTIMKYLRAEELMLFSQGRRAEELCFKGRRIYEDPEQEKDVQAVFAVREVDTLSFNDAVYEAAAKLECNIRDEARGKMVTGIVCSRFGWAALTKYRKQTIGLKLIGVPVTWQPGLQGLEFILKEEGFVKGETGKVATGKCPACGRCGPLFWRRRESADDVLRCERCP